MRPDELYFSQSYSIFLGQILHLIIEKILWYFQLDKLEMNLRIDVWYQEIQYLLDVKILYILF